MSPKPVQVSITNTQEQMIPGVMYYSDDLVGLMNEILVLIVKYFGCIKEREHLFSKIKNNAFFIKMI